MSQLERNLVGIVIVLSMLWGGGLLAAYLLKPDDVVVSTDTDTDGAGASGTFSPAQAKPPTPSAGFVAPTPAAGNPAASTVSVALAGVTPATVVLVNDPAAGLPTLAEKREHLHAASATITPQRWPVMPQHPRWEDRRGTVLPPPATPAGAPSLNPPLFSVHFKDVPIATALTQVGRMAGVRIVPVPPQQWRYGTSPTVTLDVDQQPLMELLNELCCKAGLVPWRSNGGWGMPAVSRPSTRPTYAVQMGEVDQSMGPWVVSGPFSFEIVRISHVVSLANGDAGQLSLQLNVSHDPKVTVLGQMADVVEASDEHGASLVAQSSPQGDNTGGWFGFGMRRRIFVETQGQWQSTDQPLNLQLAVTPNAGRQIVRMKVTAHFLLPTALEHLELPGVVAGDAKPQTVAGLTIAVTAPLPDNPFQVVRQITFTRGSQSDADWQTLRGIFPNLNTTLLDAQGAAAQRAYAYLQSGDDKTAVYQYAWNGANWNGQQPNLKPAKLLIDVPKTLANVEVPIEFDHLPLP